MKNPSYSLNALQIAPKNERRVEPVFIRHDEATGKTTWLCFCGEKTEKMTVYKARHMCEACAFEKDHEHE